MLKQNVHIRPEFIVDKLLIDIKYKFFTKFFYKNVFCTFITFYIHCHFYSKKNYFQIYLAEFF